MSGLVTPNPRAAAALSLLGSVNVQNCAEVIARPPLTRGSQAARPGRRAVISVSWRIAPPRLRGSKCQDI